MNTPQKTIIRETFNTVADGYDSKALRFFSASAGHMAGLLGLQGDEQVLDVACGTGNASMAVARRLPRGRVTAVDFSPGMLDQARRKAASMNIGNITFQEMDMESLDFPDAAFDAALCAFGIFFVEDMDAQLARIAAPVRPGGRIVISNFDEHYFRPLKDLFFRRLEGFGVPLPPQTWKRIARADGCRQLFEKAGLEDVRTESRNMGYFLQRADEWWDIVWNAGFRRMVSQLSPEAQGVFREEHLKEVEATRTADGIRLDVGVLFTTGTKPLSPGRNPKAAKPWP